MVITTAQLHSTKSGLKLCPMSTGIVSLQVLEMFNLFRLLENKRMEMFRIREETKASKNLLQRKSANLSMVKKYLSSKIQNKDFGWRVNQVISSLDYENV